MARSRHLRVLVALALVVVPCVAAAGPIASGPVAAVGYSGDEDGSGTARDLAFVSAGWRWRFDGADCLDGFFEKLHADFSWAVEPLVGGVFGDSDAFEASVVPYARFAPLGWERVVPYLEGGVGLAYTTLHNYGLGSAVEFSDNIGIGVEFGSGHRWHVGYRFRHLSHAGLFDDRNDGLNAHFLVLVFE